MTRTAQALSAAVAVFALAGAFGAFAQTGARFDTPQTGMEALVTALTERDRDAVLGIFGPGSLDVISTGDRPRDIAMWTEFLELYADGSGYEPEGSDTVTVVLGRDLWPFPVPMRQDDGGWYFDVESARDEIRTRRIGYNELDVIGIMGGYVAAQAEYRQTDWDGDGVLEFASNMISSDGARDGLYWPGGGSPAGDLVARATAAGYSIDGEPQAPQPYAGYLFRLLSHQGAAAPGGAMSYDVNGNRVAGHALLATPADYGVTGVVSFMVSENGVVYQSNLGPDTASVAAMIEVFDPGEGWTAAEGF